MIEPNTSRIARVDFDIIRDGKKLTVQKGDPLFIKDVHVATETAMVHIGGNIYAPMSFHYLEQVSREADVDELKKELLHCQCCDRIEVKPGQWKPKPACFTPRPGVTLVPHNCPACDV